MLVVIHRAFYNLEGRHRCRTATEAVRGPTDDGEEEKAETRRIRADLCTKRCAPGRLFETCDNMHQRGALNVSSGGHVLLPGGFSCPYRPHPWDFSQLLAVQ